MLEASPICVTEIPASLSTAFWAMAFLSMALAVRVIHDIVERW